MKDADHEDGRLVSRRALLVGLGALITLSLGRRAGADAAGASSRCVLTPTQAEGPYFVDERLNRSDIRANPADGSLRAGVPLALTLRIAALDGTGCMPLLGAIVDIWHCDAGGIYSDVVDGASDTPGSKFLRGYQIADTEGAVRFTTVYTGWYPGQAVHIHLKVRAGGRAGRHYELTSQLYFDQAVTERVYARRGAGWPRNAGDVIFRRGGRQLVLTPVAADTGNRAAFDVALHLA